MIQSADVATLKNKLEQDNQLILIDCREQAEWDQGHIKGAKLVPLGEIASHIEKMTDKEAPVYIQCRSGQRSMKACQMLLACGFTDLYNVEGGIIAWQNAGFSISHD